MKYLTICMLLLPLVYGAAVDHKVDADLDLIPDISKAEDGFPKPKVHLPSEITVIYSVTNNFNINLGNAQAVPDMSKIADGWNSDYANIDYIPDMSTKEDGEQLKKLSLADLIAQMLHPDVSSAAEDADHIPDISEASDKLDHEASIYQIPDMSVAADADNKAADQVPDISVAADAADAAEARPLFRLLASQLKKTAVPQADADLIPDMSVAGDAADDKSGNLAKRLGLKLH